MPQQHLSQKAVRATCVKAPLGPCRGELCGLGVSGLLPRTLPRPGSLCGLSLLALCCSSLHQYLFLPWLQTGQYLLKGLSRRGSPGGSLLSANRLPRQTWWGKDPQGQAPETDGGIRLPRLGGGGQAPQTDPGWGAGSPNRWGRRAPWTAQVQEVIRVPRPRQRASCGGKPTRDIPGKPDVSHLRGSPLCPVSTAVKRGFGDANSSDLAFLPCCCCC